MDQHADQPDAGAPRLEVAPTGNTRVDAVLDEVADLADRPVSEHVEVFERAHEQLRRALDAPAED